jgi:hypothetical protein
MVSKKDNGSSDDVLVLNFGAVTVVSYGTDLDHDDITTLGTDRGFVALLGSYSLPMGASVNLLTKGEFVGSEANERMLEDAEVWAEISFGDAVIEADVVSDNHLLETLFITNAKLEKREG